MDGFSAPVRSFGTSLLSSPPALLAVPSLWLCAPGPVLRQTWLIERESCSLLISSDSSALPEVGVPPRAESFHGEITPPSRKTQIEPRVPGQHARGAR